MIPRSFLFWIAWCPSLPGLDVALNITEGRVAMSSSFHRGVIGSTSDSLLGGTLNVVSDTLGVGLGLLVGRSGLGFSLLGSTGAGEVFGANDATDRLLCASHSRVVSVGKSVSHDGNE